MLSSVSQRDRVDIAALVAASLFSGVWYALALIASGKSVSDDTIPEIAEFVALVGGALGAFKIVDKAEEWVLTDADGRRRSLSNALKCLNVVLNTAVKAPAVFVGAELALRAAHPALPLFEMGSTLPTLGATFAAAVAAKETALKFLPFSQLNKASSAAFFEAATVMIAGHYLIGDDAKTISFGLTLLLQNLLKRIYCSSAYPEIAASTAGEAAGGVPLLADDADDALAERQQSSWRVWDPRTWCSRRAATPARLVDEGRVVVPA